MPNADLILLHAPSIYDFRRRPILYGPISDVVPSTQIFEMYPLGFTAIASHLERHGFKVRIINLAVRMLRDPRFQVEAFIRQLNPLAFGIDLHWMPHVQGSLEVAKLVKRFHPQAPVIFGGLSATYYHRELLDYPQVDFVVRGDSTEEPLLELMRALRARSDLSTIPNLAGKNGNQLFVNQLSCVPADLNAVELSYETIMRMVLRYRDLESVLPFRDWLSYPATAVFTCRGCYHDCGTCGGSGAAYRALAFRSRPAFRGPERLASDLQRIERYIRAPILILGDVREGGPEYTESFLHALSRTPLKNEIVFELFRPAEPEFLKAIARSVRRFNLEISPESHSEEVRFAFGRKYFNRELEATIEQALGLGVGRIDLFFMIGLPKQTEASVQQTVQYCGDLLKRFGSPKRVRPFIAPLAPFLDPGSTIFENPAPNGYRLFYRTLEEHRQAMETARTWQEMLNYETVWMSRERIVQATYSAVSELVGLKAEHGLMSRTEGDKVRDRLAEARSLLKSAAAGRGDVEEWARRVARLNQARPPEKWELQWRTGMLKLNLPRMLSCLWRK